MTTASRKIKETDIFKRADNLISTPAKVITGLGIIISLFVTSFTVVTSVKGHIDRVSVFMAEATERLGGIENSLILSHETQKYILDKNGGAYWLSDSSGQTIEVGAGAEELTGRKTSQLMGYGWTMFVVEQDKPALWEKIAITKARDLNWDHEFRMVKPDGDTIKVHSFAIKIKKNDVTIYYMGELRDTNVEKSRRQKSE